MLFSSDVPGSIYNKTQKKTAADESPLFRILCDVLSCCSLQLMNTGEGAQH